MHQDLQQNPMQLLIFRCVHKGLMQLFHVDLMVLLSNLNHIYDHVQLVLVRFFQLQHKSHQIEDEIGHELEIAKKELFYIISLEESNFNYELT